MYPRSRDRLVRTGHGSVVLTLPGESCMIRRGRCCKKCARGAPSLLTALERRVGALVVPGDLELLDGAGVGYVTWVRWHHEVRVKEEGAKALRLIYAGLKFREDRPWPLPPGIQYWNESCGIYTYVSGRASTGQGSACRQNCLRAETIGALNNDWTKYRYSGPVLGEPGVVLERAVVAWGHRDEYPHDVVLTWHRYVERAPPGEGRKMVRPGGTIATFCPPLAPLAPHDLVFRLPNH